MPAIDEENNSSTLVSLISGKSVPSRGMPSSTQSGSCVPLSDAVPRIRILAGAPGAPLTAVVCTPATCPLNIISTLDTPACKMLAAFTFDTAEVSFLFSIFWYPVTTTSPKVLSASCKVTVTKDLFFILTCCASYPMKLQVNRSTPFGTEKEKTPFISVVVPKL